MLAVKLVNSSQIITSLQIFVLIFERNTFYGYIKRRLEMPTKPNIIKKKFLTFNKHKSMLCLYGISQIFRALNLIPEEICTAKSFKKHIDRP